MMTSRIAGGLAAVLCADFAHGVATPRQRPQYILVNKGLGAPQPNRWSQDDPNSCTQSSIDEIFSLVGTNGTDARRLGVAMQFSVMDTDPAWLVFLERMLNLSLANDLPVSFALDTFQFWEARPDLWNFFNASAPGYNIENVFNVEWTSWSSENATQIAWRNWGSQFRVPPHPNLASPAVLDAYAAALRPAAELVAAWYAQLVATGREGLLAAVKVSWEVEIGLNFFYYADGNARRSQPAAGDPTSGLPGSVQQGYNAVCTAGLACSGALTAAQLDAVVSAYLARMAGVLLAAGLPRSKLLTHVGADFGQFPPAGSGGLPLVWNTGMAAVGAGARTGYSVYRYAYNPAVTPGLDVALDALDGASWAASEWLYMGGNGGSAQQQWAAAFAATLAYRNARLVHVFNWESIQGDPDALAALAGALDPAAAPPCLVDPVRGLTAALSADNKTVVLTWGASVDADADALDVATSPETLPSGALAAPGVLAGANVTGLASFALPVPANSPGAVLYASIVSTGCGGGGEAVQLEASLVVSVVLPGGA